MSTKTIDQQILEFKENLEKHGQRSGENSTVEENEPLILSATVTRCTDYGAFCQLENGWSGLIHISHITSSFVRRVEDWFETKKTYLVEVIDIKDFDKKMLKLSTKGKNLPQLKQVSAIDETGSGFGKLRNNLDNWVKVDEDNSN